MPGCRPIGCRENDCEYNTEEGLGGSVDYSTLNALAIFTNLRCCGYSKKITADWDPRCRVES